MSKMQTEGCVYLVLELGTGLVDGWYSEELIWGMQEHWDRKRPEYPHVTVKLAQGDLRETDLPNYLPDVQMMHSWDGPRYRG